MITKNCSKCKANKPASEFHKGTDPNGLSSYCKTCANLYYAQRYAPKTERMFRSTTHKECRMCRNVYPLSSFPPRRNGTAETYCHDCRSAYSRKRNIEQHGITVEDYAKQYASLDGKCTICGQNRQLQIDHDHKCCSGNRGCRKCIRGLICTSCNKTLGMVYDDPGILLKMISYLNSGDRPFM